MPSTHTGVRTRMHACTKAVSAPVHVYTLSTHTGGGAPTRTTMHAHATTKSVPTIRWLAAQACKCMVSCLMVA